MSQLFFWWKAVGSSPTPYADGSLVIEDSTLDVADRRRLGQPAGEAGRAAPVGRDGGGRASHDFALRDDTSRGTLGTPTRTVIYYGTIGIARSGISRSG